MEINELKTSLECGLLDESIRSIYGEKEIQFQVERYLGIVDQYKDIFTDYGIAEAGLITANDVHLFSAPGRCEILGNHTDHQNGKVIAASVNIDMAAAAGANGENVIRVLSEGYEMAEVDLYEMSPVPSESGKMAGIIRGVTAALKAAGYRTGGFNAYVSSNIPEGAGVSSSAAFEILIGNIISGLFNEGNIDAVTIAKAGKTAENDYFGKPSGLMDQIACSVGGIVYIDFENPESPDVQSIDFSFEDKGYQLCLVDTGSSHADLTDAYAQIPEDMKKVAGMFGKNVLRQVNEAELGASFSRVMAMLGERPLRRAIHFFNEEERVDEVRNCLKDIDREVVVPDKNDPSAEPIRYTGMERVLELICESGQSSYKDLGNVCLPGQERTSKMVQALSLSWELLQGRGAFRVHGGGFAGTILAIVPDDLALGYETVMNEELGTGSCRFISIRPAGGTMLV